MFFGGNCLPCCGCGTYEAALGLWTALLQSHIELTIEGAFPRTVSMAIDLTTPQNTNTGLAFNANPFYTSFDGAPAPQDGSREEFFEGFLRYVYIDSDFPYVGRYFPNDGVLYWPNSPPRELILLTLRVRLVKTINPGPSDAIFGPPKNPAIEVNATGPLFGPATCFVSGNVWFLRPDIVNAEPYLGVSETPDPIFFPPDKPLLGGLPDPRYTRLNALDERMTPYFGASLFSAAIGIRVPARVPQRQPITFSIVQS